MEWYSPATFRKFEMNRMVECVPNFSEGNDTTVIDKIATAIESVKGIKMLNIDSGKAANRTVMTFAGAPGQIVEAAFRGIKVAAETIDMRKHSGEHPRFGATDVCPLIPLSGVINGRNCTTCPATCPTCRHRT